MWVLFFVWVFVGLGLRLPCIYGFAISSSTPDSKYPCKADQMRAST